MKALELLLAMEGDRPWSISFVHDGPPQSKQRARVVTTKYGTRAFTPESTLAAEEALSWRWKLVLRGVTHDGCLAIACVFYRQNRQRIDTDNLVKLVLDAGTKANVWHDDSQIVGIIARIEHDPENPRTEIALMPSVSTMDRRHEIKRTCEFCKREFVQSITAAYRGTGRFCSGACFQAIRREIAKCRHCGKDFVRRRAGQALCSKECADASATIRHDERVACGRMLGPPLCQKCGARVSRREYKQCAKCLGRGRPKGSTNKEQTK